MSIGFTEIVRNAIIDDISSSRTAASLSDDLAVDSLPLFASSSDVPLYLYTPVWELLGLSSSGELADAVVCNLGEQKIPSGPCIIIEAKRQCDSGIAPFSSLRSDETGARYGEFHLAVCNVRSDLDIDMVEQVSFRVEWLIDFLARQQRGVSGDLTVQGAYGILPNLVNGLQTGGIFRVRYRDSYTPTASRWDHLYSVEFTRIFC